MYSMKLGDYEYIFEYDNAQDLKEQLELTKKTHQEILKIEEQYKKVNKIINIQKDIPQRKTISFNELELKFISYLKEEENETQKKVSKSSLKGYANTFNKLKKFFGNKNIDDITNEDFRGFRRSLVNMKFNNKTINTHMIMVRKFLNFGVDKNLITKNNAKMSELKEVDKNKELFSKRDLKNIFEHEFDGKFNEVFKILIYSGMRISELYNLKQEHIKFYEDDEIYYFDIVQAKTKSGIRQVPIHKNILDMVLNMKFPIYKKTNNAFQKDALKELYKIIDKKSTKSVHTFRANFANRCINAYPNYVELIQEILGHSGGSKDITTKTYGKGFNLRLKKEVVDSVSYF